MCKAPKPPKQKEPDKPEWLRNPYLDRQEGGGGALAALRTGRSALRIDLGSGLAIRSAQAATSQPATAAIQSPQTNLYDAPAPIRRGPRRFQYNQR